MGNGTFEKHFMDWLSGQISPARFPECARTYKEIEDFCLKMKIISTPLFEISDYTVANQIKQVVGKNQTFRTQHKKAIWKYEAAANYLCKYFKIVSERAESDPKATREAMVGRAFSETAIGRVRRTKKSSDLAEISASSKSDGGVERVLETHYKYGFKYNSIRELMRFRQFADEMNITVPQDDNHLQEAILAAGTVIDGKVYYKSADIYQELQNIVEDIFSSGTQVIYYESLLMVQLEWMSFRTITSAEILKEHLQKCIEGCSFAKRFMMRGGRRTEREAVTEELRRVWGMGKTASIDDLCDRLPYVPSNNLWRVISASDLFVFVSEGRYLLLDRFHIADVEIRNILDYVERACAENGFASLSDIPLEDLKEENYELTLVAIHQAIYRKALADTYYLNGKILTPNKADLSVVVLLKQYIMDRDECTLEELADKVIELTGGENRQHAFQALYDDMVRVDRNRFVANRLVNFNIDEIDKVLASFVTDHFRALKEITTFAMFPICGQSWNHYLLESYCYKYSKKYSLHTVYFNNRNAGIIAEKDFNKQYNDMLSIAAARADVELTPENVGKYLFSAGYTARSKYAKLEEVTRQAEKLRKEA